MCAYTASTRYGYEALRLVDAYGQDPGVLTLVTEYLRREETQARVES